MFFSAGNLWLRKDSGCSRVILQDGKILCCFMFVPPGTPDVSFLPLCLSHCHHVGHLVSADLPWFWFFDGALFIFNICRKSILCDTVDRVVHIDSPYYPPCVWHAGFWQMLQAGILKLPLLFGPSALRRLLRLWSNRFLMVCVILQRSSCPTESAQENEVRLL